MVREHSMQRNMSVKGIKQKQIMKSVADKTRKIQAKVSMEAQHNE